MTNAFDWKGKPSKIGEELRKAELKRNNARGGAKTPTTDPRPFHVYSKAVPSKK